MTSPNTQIKLTYQDYINLPESETDRYELLEGELVMVPSPHWSHQVILKRLFRLLDDYVMNNKLGEVCFAPLDVILSPEAVLQPDILFISKDRQDIIKEQGVQGAPDLVIEIASPTTKDRDRTLKKTLYARHRVKEYWIVDPEEKTVAVFTLGKKGFKSVEAYKESETLNSPLLKELEINLSKVF